MMMSSDEIGVGGSGRAGVCLHHHHYHHHHHEDDDDDDDNERLRWAGE